MKYSYSVCYCRECIKMDLKDRNRYDSNEAYCTEYRKYYNTNSKACSSHFVYNEALEDRDGCYITTAIVDILGLKDNTPYLEKLRNFRDNVMRKDENLKKILIEYDIVGPIISLNLLDDENKYEKSIDMLSNYIIPISFLLDMKKYNEAVIRYEMMVNNLINTYSIEKINVDENKINTKNIGKGHKVKLKNKFI